MQYIIAAPIGDSAQANQRIVVRKQAAIVGPTYRLPPVDACAMSFETSLVVRTKKCMDFKARGWVYMCQQS